MAQQKLTSIQLHANTLSNASILSNSDTRLLSPASLSHRNSFDLRNSTHTSYGKSPVSLSPNDDSLQFDYNLFVTTWQDQIKMRQYEKCAKYCQEVIEKLSSSEELQKSKSKVHFSLAYLLKKYIKKYDEAKEEYLKSIAVDKENPGAHFNLANMLVDHYKDYKNAQLHFETAIALEPLYALYRMTYAEFLWHDMQKYEDAAAQYEQLIVDFDGNNNEEADIHFNYGLLLRDKLHKMEEAAEQFKAVMDITNGNDAEASEEYEYTMSLMEEDKDKMVVDHDELKEDMNGNRKKKNSVFRKSMHEMGMMINLLNIEEDGEDEKEKYIKKMKILMAAVDKKELQMMVENGVEYIEKNAEKVHQMLSVCKDVFTTFDAMDDGGGGL